MSAGSVPGAVRVRVTVADTWQVGPLSLAADATVADLKRRALAAAGLGGRRPEEFGLKAGGALVGDEGTRLEAAGLVDGSGVVVLRTRRRAVR